MSRADLKHWEIAVVQRRKAHQRFLDKVDIKAALPLLPALDEEAFARVDCLQCAHCCKGYSPRFKTPDIRRIARRLKLKESVFIETYLRLDDEGDYVARSLPCPFLSDGNICTIYEDRPSDCSRFPYTAEDVFLKRVRLTLKNASFCPIAFYVLESLSLALPEGKAPRSSRR